MPTSSRERSTTYVRTISTSRIRIGLLGDEFTLRELRLAHEAIAGRELQRDTFRRTMEPQLVATGTINDRHQRAPRGDVPATNGGRADPSTEAVWCLVAFTGVCQIALRAYLVRSRVDRTSLGLGSRQRADKQRLVDADLRVDLH